MDLYTSTNNQERERLSETWQQLAVQNQKPCLQDLAGRVNKKNYASKGLK